MARWSNKRKACTPITVHVHMDITVQYLPDVQLGIQQAMLSWMTECRQAYIVTAHISLPRCQA